jgi:hypothetical protein
MPLDPEVQWQAWELEAKRLEKENTQLWKAIEEAQAKNEAMLKSENISLAGYNSIKQILKKALEGAGKEGE